jgi:hypothetical protein
VCVFVRVCVRVWVLVWLGGWLSHENRKNKATLY